MGKEPLFLKVAKEIQKRVDNGVYVSAQRLPSEYDLADEFEVSRLTIRKAIEYLISHNILIKQKGRGTYVMQTEKIQSGRFGLQGFSEAAMSYGKASQTKLISFQKVDFDTSLWKKLQADRKEAIFHVSRLRSLDNEPVVVENVYVRSKFLKVDNEKELTNSLFRLIEENVEIAYSQQEVEAVLVDDEHAKLLEVSVGSPLLLVHSTTYSVKSIPIFYDISYYRADKYIFKNILRRRGQ